MLKDDCNRREMDRVDRFVCKYEQEKNKDNYLQCGTVITDL
jgi:hypothetical protein